MMKRFIDIVLLNVAVHCRAKIRRDPREARGGSMVCAKAASLIKMNKFCKTSRSPGIEMDLIFEEMHWSHCEMATKFVRNQPRNGT